MPLLNRLKTSLYRAHYKHLSNKKYRIAQCRGAEFVLWPGNYVDRRIWVEGIYEREQIDNMLAFAAQYKPDIFMDIGANIGLYTCIIGKNTGIRNIISFECDPRNITLFKTHVHMNDLNDRVTLHEYAVGEHDRTIDLYLASNTSTGKSSVVAPATTDHSIRQVPLRAIDNLMNPQDKTILIKMDIEGYELPALKGMINILTRNKCQMQIEILPGSHGDITRSFLKDHGYTLSHAIENDYYVRNF